jgi:hypothetical protein
MYSHSLPYRNVSQSMIQGPGVDLKKLADAKMHVFSSVFSGK